MITTILIRSVVAERSSASDSSSGVVRMWVRIPAWPVVALVSLSKTLKHNCFILRMGRKAVGPVYCVMHVNEPRTLIVKEKGLAPVFLDSRLEHPAGWICAHYKSSVLLLLLLLLLLTSSHQVPYGHANILPIDNRRTFKHAFRFLRVWLGALSTCHTWRATVRRATVRPTCIHTIVSRSPWVQKALQTMNEFTLFVDFCLIPLSKTCSFDIPAKK